MALAQAEVELKNDQAVIILLFTKGCWKGLVFSVKKRVQEDLLIMILFIMLPPHIYTLIATVRSAFRIPVKELGRPGLKTELS